MDFEWLHYDMPSATAKSIPEKTREANRAEMRERARTLVALGYDAREIAARLRRSIEWEYGETSRPAVLDELEDIVKEVSKKR
jgi:Holliday junction resolvasome RuvABC DNA-binding subunit